MPFCFLQLPRVSPQRGSDVGLLHASLMCYHQATDEAAQMVTLASDANLAAIACMRIDAVEYNTGTSPL